MNTGNGIEGAMHGLHQLGQPVAPSVLFPVLHPLLHQFSARWVGLATVAQLCKFLSKRLREALLPAPFGCRYEFHTTS